MTYELINTATTNTVASFGDEREAWLAYEVMRSQVPSEVADSLALVAFNDNGEAEQLLAAPSLHELA